MVAEVIRVNPKMARDWLETYDGRWRPREVDDVVDEYRQAMVDGLWRDYSGSHVVFDQGVLVDGWKRLTALVLARGEAFFIVEGRVPDPRPTDGKLPRSSSGRLVCQFCRGEHGRRLERRDVVLVDPEGVERWQTFVVCHGCLKTYGILLSSAQWFEKGKAGAASPEPGRTAEEQAELERTQPRYTPTGEEGTCPSCGALTRTFVFRSGARLTANGTRLGARHITQDARFHFYPNIRRVGWVPDWRDERSVWFWHSLACGARRNPPEDLTLRGLWFANGGERLPSLELSDYLFDLEGVEDGRPVSTDDQDGTSTPLF